MIKILYRVETDADNAGNFEETKGLGDKVDLTPEEAINAATINGAYAMGISNMYGSITRGKKANIIITKPVPSYAYLPYAFGNNHIETVIINGQIV